MTTSPHPTLRIFVSHSHKDNDFGVKLVDDLRRVLGDESAVWYDARGGLHGGDTWWRKIVKEITERNIFIVVLSPDSMESPWVNDEIDLAWRQKNTSPFQKHIIPVLWQQCEVRADLGSIQFISFLPPRSRDEAFNELLITLGLPPRTDRPAIPTSDPGSVLVRQMAPQIETSFSGKDWPDVIRKTNFLLRRDPAAVTSDIYHMQGVALREEGQVQEAQDAFDSALALVSDRQERLAILHDYADFLASQNQWNEMLRLANEALRLIPNNSEWVAKKEQAQSKLKKPTPVTEETKEQAQSKIQIASTAIQKTKDQWFSEGYMHNKAGQYQEAIEAYTCVIELDPKYASAYYNRGETYRLLGDYQKAIADCSRAIELDSKHVWAYGTRGAAYRMLKDYQQAIQNLSRAIGLDSNYAWAYGQRGLVYYGLKDYQRAIEDFDHALQLDPSITWFKSEREDAYRKLGRKP